MGSGIACPASTMYDQSLTFKSDWVLLQNSSSPKALANCTAVLFNGAHGDVFQVKIQIRGPGVSFI